MRSKHARLSLVAPFRFLFMGMLSVVAGMISAFENNPPNRISGTISVSAGTSYSKSFLSLSLPSDISFKASVPLNFEDDFFQKIAFGAMMENDGFKAQVGKIDLESGSSFFVSTSPNQAFKIHPITANVSGTETSPWGFALSSSIFSGFVSKSESTLSLAAQAIFPNDLSQCALSLGSVFEIVDQRVFSERIRPWFGLSALFGGRNARFLWTTQLFPELVWNERKLYENSWLSGAACGIDMRIAVKNAVIENSFYGELRDFIDARGKVPYYDMRDQIKMTMNISEKLLLRNVYVQYSVFSLQGARLDDTHSLPSSGTLPNFYFLKYWPDRAEIAASLQSNAVRITFLHFALLAEAAMRSSCIFKSQGNSAKLGFEIQLRNAEHDTHFLRGTAELKSSSSLDDALSIDTDELVFEMDETETKKEEATKIRFDCLAFSLRTNFEWFSFASSFNIPLKSAEETKMSAKLRASAQFSSFLIETLVSVAYAMQQKSLSLSSFRISARYSF